MVTKRGKKAKEVLLHHLLHADDTPHRIALGAAAGMFIAWTPTFGVQMVLAVALATLLRANKAVTIPFVWLTNPLTNVPIYAFGYAFGNFLFTGTWQADPQVTRQLVEVMKETVGLRLYEATYWANLFDLLMKVSVDLWVGSIVLGLLCGLMTYPLMYRAVIKCRKVKNALFSHDSASREPESASPAAPESTTQQTNQQHAA